MACHISKRSNGSRWNEESSRVPWPPRGTARCHNGLTDAETPVQSQEELARIVHAVELGTNLGLHVNAGHGIHYHNVDAIAAIPGIRELNIGHAIIARAVFTGLQEAVREMKRLMREAQTG